jgi:peptide/nickel transport system substrate-binding protein
MRLLTILCAFLLLAAPAHAAPDKLTIGITQFPSNFHPAIDSMAAKSYVLGFTRRPITTYDKDWRLVCVLCTELPTRENGRVKDATLPNGTKTLDVTYTIRPDATWGDGTPVTTKDVLLSWEVGKHPQSGYANGESYSRDIASITAADERSFTLRLGRPQCQYQAINDFALLPAHIEAPIFKADPAAYKLKSAFETATTNPALYNGPYVISAVTTGSSVTLARNPHWAGPPPQFTNITIRAIENTAALEANLLSGQIDMIAGELGLSLEQALALQQRRGDAYQFIYKPGLTYEHLTLNLADPRFADVRVRRALLLAVDRANLVQKLFSGKQPVAATQVHPLDRWHDAAVSPLPFDPAAAQQLLDEAGWKVGADGIRTKDGQRLSFNFSTTAGNRTRELVQQVLQANWRAIGVEARLKNEPPRVLFGQSLVKGPYDAALFAWLSAPESPPRSNLHSGMIPTAANNFAGQNFARFKDAKLDQLLDDLDQQCSAADQQRLWSELQRYYAEQLPELPLFFRAESYVLPKGMTGLIPTGHQYPSSMWVEGWKVGI